MHKDVGTTLVAILLASTPVQSGLQNPGLSSPAIINNAQSQGHWENSQARRQLVFGIIDCLLANNPKYLETSNPSIIIDESFKYKDTSFGLRIDVSRLSLEARKKFNMSKIYH